MAKHKPASKAQIDYLMASDGVAGGAAARDGPWRIFRRSDHRLVVGGSTLPAALPLHTHRASLTGWSPSGADFVYFPKG